MGVQIVPHRLLERGHGLGLHPAPDDVEEDFEDAKGDGGQADQYQQPRSVVGAGSRRLGSRGDRSVDRGLGQQRDDDLGAFGEQRRREHPGELAVIRPQVLPHPPQRGQRSLPGGLGLLDW